MKKYIYLVFALIIPVLSYGQNELPKGYLSETSQTLTIGTQKIALTAKAGTMQLRDEQNKPIALFGYTAYTKNGADSKRPIVFAFNGGPGSSSFWLHMGVLGPKRVIVKDPEFTPGAPYEIVNNEYSVLEVADLVMIDPIGTGLSVPIGEAKFQDFWGVDQDVRSISLFIAQYLRENNRYNSPKYLLGESYGTFRNAALMAKLFDMGIALNGVIMVSAVFDLRTLLFPPNDDLPYLVHFPTYAVTSWYHGKLDKKYSDLNSFLAEIRSFTESEYLTALFKGNRLSTIEKNNIADKLSAYTGISKEFWLKGNLKITAGEYFQELLRTEGQTVGRLDSRFKGYNLDLLSQTADYDPQSAAISPAYIAGFLDYFYNQLKVSPEQYYTTSAGGREGFKWDWSHRGNIIWNANAAVNTANDMARTMVRDPNVKVLILNGYYDLATVFYGVEHTIDHLELPEELRKNIIMEYYEAGHMMYTHQPSLEKFKKDVNGFILNTSAGK
jgi:carboxypeptidase C (cathepsin A)